MTSHRFPFDRPARRWLALVVIVAVGASCRVGSQPPSAPAASGDAPVAAKRSPGSAASAIRRPAAKRPDPRYRPPGGFAELEAVAAEVARASGRTIGWRLQAGDNPGPLVRIRGRVDNCTIYVHPVAARKVPPNTWAFLFGHEFAHLTESLGVHSATSPSSERKADIVGARYAMAAGYRIEAFLGWVLTEPEQRSTSHGSLHQRVDMIAGHFRVPRAVIERETQRARRYRAAN